MTASKVISARDLRDEFVKFYLGRDHRQMPRASLIPAQDPSLLLTNSGMAQFKRFFLGEAVPPSPRVTTVQPVFRTTDIEIVGDSTHLTLFEMLGNFSFGDYFKKEACEWALELMIGVLGLEFERLNATVHQDDSEAVVIWSELGFPDERIWGFDDEHNWWGPAGTEGPCGPASELHYYRGDLDREVRAPNIRDQPLWGPNLTADFVELYTLVFIQNYQAADGERTQLRSKCIDTGMGLERMLVQLQGVRDVYETDLIRPLISSYETVARKRYGENESDDIDIRTIVDHGRAASFLLSDGVVPGGTGRGYVLRRMIRRAMLAGRRLGLATPRLDSVADATADAMANAYPDIETNLQFIKQALSAEEQRFASTLDQGLQRLEETIQSQLKTGERILDGGEVAYLYDTFGFPVELTEELAAHNNLQVDIATFEREMDRRRQRARADRKTSQSDFSERNAYREMSLEDTAFLGHHTLQANGTVLAMVKDGTSVSEAREGDQLEVVLSKTPFYAAGGGQIGDAGVLGNDRFSASVIDTYSHYGNVTAHLATVEKGNLSVSDSVTATVDGHRRQKIRRNHTATHLLHAALRESIGHHVRQSGSLITSDHLRFDFTHTASLTSGEIRSVQELVNEKIRDNLVVGARWTTYNQAIEEGALAFFNEAYGNDVRTIEIGDQWSYEMCGGTHMDSTGGIGMLLILSETGIGSGLRRMVAVTGYRAEQEFNSRSDTLEGVSRLLGVPLGEIESRLIALKEELETTRKEKTDVERRVSQAAIGSNRLGFDLQLADRKLRVEAGLVPADNARALRGAADYARDNLGAGVVVLGSIISDQPRFIVLVSKDLERAAVRADGIAKSLADEIGGAAGGSQFIAEGGGGDAARLEVAFRQLQRMIEAATQVSR